MVIDTDTKHVDYRVLGARFLQFSREIRQLEEDAAKRTQEIDIAKDEDRKIWHQIGVCEWR